MIHFMESVNLGVVQIQGAFEGEMCRRMSGSEPVTVWSGCGDGPEVRWKWARRGVPVGETGAPRGAATGTKLWSGLLFYGG